jgi:CRP-like cAMP-binding protein
MAGMYEERGSSREPKPAGRELRFHKRSNSRDPDNLILAALPQKEHRYLREHLEFVPMRSGAVLWEPNEPIEFVYFPTSGMVSFVAVMRDGATAEVGITGREGFVGTAVILGARDASVRAVVQGAGSAFRIEAGLVRRILPRTPQLEQLLRRYAHSHAMQVAQAAACNCLHQVSERLARWLAMTYDRTGSDLLPLTQEFLAQMLGCRRSSVTSAVGWLQRAGVIRSGHGQVRILDRRQLERRACECYSIMKKLSGLTQTT